LNIDPNKSSDKNVHLTRNKKQLYDIEELVALGKKDRLCPYFFERDVKVLFSYKTTRYE